MKKGTKTWLIAAGVCLALFLLLTALLLTVDVDYAVLHAPVGLSTINGFVFETIGVNAEWEMVSGVLFLAAVICVIAIGVLVCFKRFRGGLRNLFSTERRKLNEFDMLVGAWILMTVCFVIFEIFVINYRPILENGEMEASFPSTHTLISVVIFGTMMVWIAYQLKKMPLKIFLLVLLGALMVVSVLARLVMGVHWLTDILGGVLLGGAIVSLCGAGICYLKEREPS